jgi:hypothetical protein
MSARRNLSVSWRRARVRAAQAATYWQLEPAHLVQSFLEGQSERVARAAEDRLLDEIIDSLPPDAVVRAMQRLALFAHLPPIRKGLPTPTKPYERIQQYPNPPPKSAARPTPPVAGGIFGPPPGAQTLVLDATQTRRPQDSFERVLPIVSPRSKPSEIERKIKRANAERARKEAVLSARDGV